jgi:hypothetical protein
MRPRRSLVILAVLAAGCGSNPTPAPTVPPATQAPTPTVTAPPTMASAVPSVSPPASVEPSAPASAAPVMTILPGFATPPPVSDTTAWSAIDWRRLDPADPIGLIASVTAWSGGFVALGRPVADTNDAGTATSARTPVWVSPDGATWTSLAPEVLGSSTMVLGVAPVPGGLAALTAQAGENQCEEGDTFDDGCFGTVPPVQSWTSSDGLGWTAHPGPFDSGETPWFGADEGTLFAMAYGDAGFDVALSADGVTWTAIDPSPIPASYHADSPRVFSTPSALLLAGGANIAGGGAPLRASIPRSVDGRHWSSVRLPSTTPGMPEDVGTIELGRTGLLAEGRTADVPGASLWWRSTDGRAWSSVKHYPPLGATTSGEGSGSYPNGMLASDGIRIVAYRDTGKAAVWASFDGAGWQRLTMRGDPPVDATFVVLPMGILAVSDAGAWFGSAS